MKFIFTIIFKTLLLLAFSCNSGKNSSDNSNNNIADQSSKRPNIILLMADDMGWGDTGYNDHPEIMTATLDDMAQNGVVFERFYAAAPVCSPTRGSVITGRNPFRYGIFYANVGSLPKEEITIAELLKDEGYNTGHFGKWHLGTLTTEVLDANRGGKPKFDDEYSPPWQHGFDVCFSTESKVPTWDPMLTPEKEAGGVGDQGLGNYFGTAYWNEKGEKVISNLEGDDSKVIMDRAIPFIENAVKSNTPFFTVIWFHTPHTPVVAGQKYLDKYKGLSKEKQHYYGCITAMDEQIGRLRNRLKELGVYENTLTFFTSDNGPENNRSRPRSVGITKGLSERKRSLKEGGIRVPGLMEYPRFTKKSKKVNTPFFTSDYLPTILGILDIEYPDQRPLDGVDILTTLNDTTTAERKPMVFLIEEQVAVIDGDYKILGNKEDEEFALYNVRTDPAELEDVSDELPSKVESLTRHWKSWNVSQESSLNGEDYE
jgi:arylsulfatase A-like enzyme